MDQMLKTKTTRAKQTRKICTLIFMKITENRLKYEISEIQDSFGSNVFGDFHLKLSYKSIL